MKLTREIVMNCRNDEENIFYIPDEYEDDFLNIIVNNTADASRFDNFNKIAIEEVNKHNSLFLRVVGNIYPLLPNSEYVCNSKKFLIV